MKNLINDVANIVSLIVEEDVAKKWTKKPLTAKPAKMKDPVHVQGVGVMEKEQAERLFPAAVHTPTRLYKEAIEVTKHKSPYEGAERGEYIEAFPGSPDSAQKFANHILDRGGKARIGTRGGTHFVYHTGAGPISKDDWRKSMKESVELNEMFPNRDSGSTDAENRDWERRFKKAQEAAKKKVHRVSVTVSDPNDPAVSNRKNKIQRIARIPHDAEDKDGAIKRAKKFYKKRGYVVHDIEHIGFLKESLDVKTLSVEDLASHHNVPVSEIEDQLSKGVKIEMEHTTDEKVAAEIARDHIKEDPKYYDKLKKVEESKTYGSTPKTKERSRARYHDLMMRLIKKEITPDQAKYLKHVTKSALSPAHMKEAFYDAAEDHKDLKTYDVPVEYGPTAADTEHHVVKARSAEHACRVAIKKHKKENPSHSPSASPNAVSVQEEPTDTDDGRNYSGQIGNSRWNEETEINESSKSIRELMKMKDKSLADHHEFARGIDAQIEAIRKKRGTKLKKVDGGDYFEPGRSREPSKGPGYY